VKGKIIIPSIFFFFLIVITVQAEQTVNTIEYPIGFVSQTIANEEYGKSITFNPPDGITEILSGELYIYGDFQAGTKIYAKIGNSFCNPNGWETPNQDVANYQIIFDCSEILEGKKTGKQEVRFLTDKIARNLYARYKITYYNYPLGSMIISGTEYNYGDEATIFLQLKDTQGFPINDGSCLIDVYYPNLPNQTHPQFLNNAPMLFMNESDGLYYYDLFVPNITGVFMLSATCSYAFDTIWVYESEDTDKSNQTVIYGTYTGDTISLNDKSDFLYMKCVYQTIDSNKTCEAYYDFNVSGALNITELQLYYSGETSATPVELYFFAWNWSSSTWLRLENYLIFQGTATTTNPSGVDEFSSNTIPLDGIISNENIVKIKLEATSTKTFTMFDNWLSLKFLSENGTIQDLKGSGELHISDFESNITKNIGNLANLTALEVWIYYNRTLTDYNQSGIFARLNQIDQLIRDVNQSIWGKLFSIQDDLGSINNSINLMNYTVMTKLFSIQDDLQDIFDEVVAVYNLIQSVNTSIQNKLYNIQTDIYNLGTLINQTNSSIMNKLYLIQDDLDYLQGNLSDQLLNITNISIQIIGNLSEVSYDTWALFFKRGTPPLAPSTDYFCSNNFTLIKRINYTFVENGKTDYFVKDEEISCEFGCINGTIDGQSYCSPHPAITWIALIIIILAIIYIVWRFS